ncbi:MAG: hypothetical protein U0869_16795 [Chloroflexota bacterium]
MHRFRIRRSWLPAIPLLALLLLPFLALPAVAQDGSEDRDRGVQVAVKGDVSVAADQRVGVVVVVDGTATIAGETRVVVVVKGTLTMLSGSSAERVVVVDSTTDIQAGASVDNDVLQLRGTVTVDPGATIGGQVKDISLDVGAWATAFAGAVAFVGFILWLAFVLLTWVAGLLLAAFGARQVRSAEWLISTDPGKTFVAGVALLVGLPIIAVLLMVTVVLIPVGLVLLLVVWPLLGFLGWLVAATWIGEWILRTAGRPAPERRPYLGVTLGLIVAGIASLIPFLGLIIALFGMGAVTLAGWRMLRAPRTPQPGPGGYLPVGG